MKCCYECEIHFNYITLLFSQIKRFKTYIYLLQGKISAIPDLEPSLTETTIGEYEEMGATPSAVFNPVAISKVPSNNLVQKSLSDRYSYRAAIYQNETADDDIIQASYKSDS